MTNVPVRDQGNLGTCYAYTAASAIDAWRFSARPPGDLRFHTSPHAAAIAERINRNPSARKDSRVALNPGHAPIDSGVEIASVNAVKQHGACSYEALGANFGNSIYHKNPSSFWVLLQNFYDFYHKQYIDALKSGNEKEALKILNAARNTLGSQLCLANLNPKLKTFDDIKQMKSFLLSDDIFDGLKILSDRICAGQTIKLPPEFPDKPNVFIGSLIPIPGALGNPKAKRLIFDRMISAMLNFKNRQPLMIAYNSKVFSDPHAGSMADHSSLIIGRRRLTDGRCGYLIRNSWGTDGGGLGDTDRVDKNGDILVAAEDLIRSLDRVSVLPPQGEEYKPPEDLYAGVDEIMTSFYNSLSTGPLPKEDPLRKPRRRRWWGI
ncbi:MAG: hypothetical protein IPK04_21370 [Bdellovibrionales bacterium]|nr:hypothetical protein [Bdellovibrionales bacterium]